MEISRKKETGQDLKRRGRGREGQTEAKTEGQERSRVMVRWRPGLGDKRAGWRPRLEGRGRLPLGESGKGARGAGARPTPHIPPAARLPPLGGGSVSGAAARVCEGRRGGNRCRGRKGRKGPGARPGAAGRLTRGLRGRRPPGLACAAEAERPRPGGAASGEGSASRPGRGVGGGELGYLCLFPDHIVGAEQVSQEQVELLLLRRGRRHCARREREGGRGDRSREARWRAGGRGGGGPSAGTGTSGGAGLGGPGGKGRGKGERGGRGGASRPLTPPRPPVPAPHWPWARRAGPRPLLGGRADWPRTLQCRHRRRAARDSAAQLRPGLRRAGGGRSQPVVVRGVRPGWGGGTSSRAREISSPWSGRPPSLPARSPSRRLEERPQLQSPRPPRP